MAAEPSKTEIQTLFKRLRAIPTNKVHEGEGRGSGTCREGLSLPRRGLREGERRRWAVLLGCQCPASTRGPDCLLICFILSGLFRLRRQESELGQYHVWCFLVH